MQSNAIPMQSRLLILSVPYYVLPLPPCHGEQTNTYTQQQPITEYMQNERRRKEKRSEKRNRICNHLGNEDPEVPPFGTKRQGVPGSQLCMGNSVPVC